MENIRRNLVLVVVGFLVLGFAGISLGQDLFVKDEFIVKFKSGVSGEVIRGINRRHGTSVSKQGKFRRLSVPAGRSVEELVKIYSRNPNVEYAEPNYIAHAFWTPDDPLYPYQWHFYNAEYGGINMEAAWGIQTGDLNVIVAVIDTGVAYEDYTESIPIGNSGKYRYITYEQAPDLANTNFVAGYDFVNDDTHPNDDEGHGTHVTGTIAQSTNNTIGVAGVAFNTSIMPVKVLDSDGSGTYADIAEGNYFAADNGAHVINMSLGGSSSSITLEDAIAYAYNKGVTIVAAAGNDDSNVISYPAAYDAYVIAVGATRYDETLAYYSNYGSSLDIVAPGGDTTVDQNGDGYGDGVLQQTFGATLTDWGYYFYQGTSTASPHVAGTAALVIANGVTGPDNVREALQSTAKDLGPAGWDETYGWGRVDAYAALNYSPEPTHDVAITNITAPSSILLGDLVSIDVAVANQGDFDETFTLTLTDTTDGVEIGSVSVALAAGASTTETFTWDTTSATLGDHVLDATASIVEGETDISDNSKTVTVSVVELSTMHVANIEMALETAGVNINALATVTIVDADGLPVEGATVAGSWSGATSDFDSGVTDATGKVTLQSDRVKKAASGTTFTFAVTDVTLSGWSYDSAANVETSDSITVP